MGVSCCTVTVRRRRSASKKMVEAHGGGITGTANDSQMWWNPSYFDIYAATVH